MSPGQRPEIEPGILTCRRCGSISPIRNRSGKFTCPYCEKCRTPQELERDLGCEACPPRAPLCLEAPTGFKCPKRVFP